MVDFGRIVLGVSMVTVGALALINHPLVDKYNRWWKAGGTTQQASDIEMSEASILLGRIFGAVFVILGFALFLTGLS